MKSLGMWEGQALIDTGSELNLVRGVPYQGGDNKNGTLYNIFPALLSGTADMKAVNQTVSYGNVTFEGSWANNELFTDKKGKAVPKFDFFYAKSVLSGQIDEGVDAIFGLARQNQKFKLNKSATPTAKSSLLD